MNRRGSGTKSPPYASFPLTLSVRVERGTSPRLRWIPSFRSLTLCRSTARRNQSRRTCSLSRDASPSSEPRSFPARRRKTCSSSGARSSRRPTPTSSRGTTFRISTSPTSSIEPTPWARATATSPPSSASFVSGDASGAHRPRCAKPCSPRRPTGAGPTSKLPSTAGSYSTCSRTCSATTSSARTLSTRCAPNSSASRRRTSTIPSFPICRTGPTRTGTASPPTASRTRCSPRGSWTS
mmetsp:Transcript_52124/g.156448  ORF Transcript_52124/g.156448 Transcript_52124/m.156448 type:complete len:238 (+) Transcript_52124:1198-1911(+)